MTWTDIRRHYPHQWLLVEALLAHSTAGKRQLDELAVIDAFADGEAALRSYLKLHRDFPARELYVVHSDREDLEITERFVPGRGGAGNPVLKVEPYVQDPAETLRSLRGTVLRYDDPLEPVALND